MKKTFLQHLWVLALVLISVACRQSPAGQEGAVAVANPTDTNGAPTVVYLVRHAEKDISDPANQDPDLTPEGLARAEALQELLQSEKVDALYSTNYLRTTNTLKPMAAARNLEIKKYEAHDFSGLKSLIMQQHAGQTVVISGHSNTLLPIVEAFGAQKPVADITDNQYDYIFKLEVAPNGTATVHTDSYGTASR